MPYCRQWVVRASKSFNRTTKKILSKYNVELIGATKSVIEKVKIESYSKNQ